MDYPPYCCSLVKWWLISGWCRLQSFGDERVPYCRRLCMAVMGSGECGTFQGSTLHQIETVLLDYQSVLGEVGTGINEWVWKIEPEIKEADMISDPNSRHQSSSCMETGDEQATYRHINTIWPGWKQYTGLPFVFAAWISNKHYHRT